LIQRFGHRLGARLALRGAFRRSLRYLIVPVNYWRHLEYRLACEALAIVPGDLVLDVGSPKLLAAYLAEKAGATVWATDIDGYFLPEYESVRQVLGIPSDRLRLAAMDGRRLGFDDGMFSKAYAISVLEHIPDSGDSECLAEMARVLTPGGICVVTVPFWPTTRIDHRDDFYWSHASKQDAGGRLFYQRRYSEADLYERLVAPSGLSLEKLAYVGERVLAGSDREVGDFLHPLLGPIQPALSRLLHTRPTPNWRELKKPLCALLVLRKPREVPWANVS
jgi:ubiquinone/menaquinone biosynthesis C-methylase UbiE